MAIERPPYIIAGAYAKRYYNAPTTRLFLSNIAAMLQAGQTAALAEQELADGLAVGTLPVVPNDKFFVGAVGDPNALSVAVVGKQSAVTDAGSKTVTLNALVVTTTESSDPVQNYLLADNYSAAWEAILDTWGLQAPARYAQGWGGPSFTPDVSVVARNIIDKDTLIPKSFGILPIIEITVTYFATTNPPN